MKATFTLTTLAICASIILLQSYSAGPTTSGARATGAPGDGSSTCVSCHNNSGSFGNVSIDLKILDAAGNDTNLYEPNTKYDLEITVTSSMGSPAGYGFQMICLDSDDANYDGWANPSANAQLNTSASRNYVEQDGMSDTNVFTVEWTAPTSETGDMTFYIGANAVNDDNGTGGDRAAIDQFTIGEMEADEPQDSSNSIFSISKEDLRVYPNPTRDFIRVDGISKDDRVTITSMSGQRFDLPVSLNSEYDLSAFANGAYIINSESTGHQATIIKR